ncbi:OpgC family protein [Caldovatus aquaticus]|uniref:OpgC domain-containing protein n=1 Tax=Caldovatus aquaticus TaxID=2865671 RepID=A0ABS7F1Q4_9PROT|nr:OpgC domain-containing protein [Caldovatus aquaticus]MBW8269551.1 OpgC domain-containing protein [Caldovatus aquaticus]
MFALIRQDRDLRVDFFRGLSLWIIFVNHIPGNWLGLVTPRNYMLADATETFVLLAGYAAGLAYGIVMDRQGWLFAASRVMGRVFTLYVAHIFLLVVFTAQVGYSAERLDAQAYLDELQLDPFAREPYRALLEALLLRYQPSFLNILPLYIVLLAMFAVAMPLLRRPWLLLGASAALYVATRTFDWDLPSWSGEGWFFNPLGWQFLFFIGCALGYRPPGGAPFTVPYRRWLVALSLALLALGVVATQLLYFRWDIAEQRLPAVLARFLAGIDKAAMHPMRLATMLALAYLAAHFIPRTAAWLRGWAAAPFVLMGQQALPVFCAGIALSFLGRVALEISDQWPMQLLVNLAGPAALTLIAALTAWYGTEKRAARRGAAPAAAAAGAPAGAAPVVANPLPAASGRDSG